MTAPVPSPSGLPETIPAGEHVVVADGHGSDRLLVNIFEPFTGEPAGALRIVVRGERSNGVEVTSEQARHLLAMPDRPHDDRLDSLTAPPVPPLPAGVEEISDGWVARGAVLPSLAGWERRDRKSHIDGWLPITDEASLHPHTIFEVRPAAPSPRMVPWKDAEMDLGAGRLGSLHPNGGRYLSQSKSNPQMVVVAMPDGSLWPEPIPASGLVPVLDEETEG